MAKERILVVEDELLVAMSIKDTLEKAGYVVPAMAASGEEAIELAEQTQPALALMDIKLKGVLDGVETAEKLNGSKDIPSIYLTAYSDEEIVKRAKATDSFGYLMKPFKDKELLITIEMALYKHRTQKQLKESRQWFCTLLQSMRDAVIATDGLGFVRFMNPIAENLTGFKESKAKGKALEDLLKLANGETGESVGLALDAVIGKNRLIKSEDHILIREDGRHIPVDHSAAPIKNGRSTFGAIVILRDITDRKEAETQRIKLERMQHEAKKREAVAILSRGIAHDFNNILTAIMGNISLAILDTDSDEKAYRCLKNASEASVRAKDLIDRFIDFSGDETPQKTIGLAQQLIKDSVGLALDGSNVQSAFSIADDLWEIEVDQARFSQVLNTLLDNAREAMPLGGTVQVEAENVHLTGDHVARGGNVPNGRYVRISVGDQGLGISADHIDKLFDPYFSTKTMGTQKGMGLGLAIANAVIAKHEGYIEVESEEGHGALFNIYLPAVVKEK